MTLSQQAPLVERPHSAKCLGERFQDAFLAAWGQERGVAYADLPAEAQAKWNRAAVAFVCTLSDAPSEAAARITELEGDLKAAFREISKLAREAGEATGRLAMSEAAGIVDGWRERAERAEARCRALREALGGLTALYDDDEGCRKLPEYVAAVQALEGALPESPSADAGPYPRSHEPQRSHALAAFATHVLEALWEGYDLDGGEIQDLGQKFGLIKAVAYDPSTHVDVHGVGPEPGDEWFVQESWLTDLANASQHSDGGRV